MLKENFSFIQFTKSDHSLVVLKFGSVRSTTVWVSVSRYWKRAQTPTKNWRNKISGQFLVNHQYISRGLFDFAHICYRLWKRDTRCTTNVQDQWVKGRPNGGVSILTGSLKPAVSAHAQYDFGQIHREMLTDCRNLPCGIAEFVGWCIVGLLILRPVRLAHVGGLQVAMLPNFHLF